jgi:hypothetical protein
MAIYYCWSGGTNTAPYDTWTKAATTLATAMGAANANGDQIQVAPEHTEELSVDTTYTILNNISIVCVDRSTGFVSTMGSTGWLGNSTANRSVTFAGAFKLYTYGLTVRLSGNSSDQITLASTDGSHQEHENCFFWISNNQPTGHLQLGPGAVANANAYVLLKNCKVMFGNPSQSILIRSSVDIFSLEIDETGSSPSNIFISTTDRTAGANVKVYGSNLSHAGSGNIVGASTSVPLRIELNDCKLGASFSALASQTPANKGAATVQLNNCSSGDEHYHFGYYDAFGEITCVTSPFCNDGALFDGTNPVAWRIITTSNADFYTPFVTPWIEKYHAGMSAITPFIEILNNASTSALQDDEIWAEFGAQATSGSTQASYTGDRMTLLGSPDNQDAGIGLSGWTGESGTAWSGKLVSPSALTPAEIGTLKARVFVGEPSITVFVDPTIRT